MKVLFTTVAYLHSALKRTPIPKVISLIVVSRGQQASLFILAIAIYSYNLFRQSAT